MTAINMVLYRKEKRCISKPTLKGIYEMSKNGFAGDKKVGQSILTRPEKAFVAWGTPKVPKCIETYHLTMLTVLWSLLNILFGYLARNDLRWLWMVSLMIVFQYISDLFDGAVGRARNTGLVKWGFYMDHFLDYLFLLSLVTAGYLIAPAGLGIWHVFLMVLVGCFMVNSFLCFAATNEFEIYHYGFGPTELRIAIILINTFIIFAGVNHFKYTVPGLCILCTIALIVMVYRSHKMLWEMDMKALRDLE
ncbi:CDP-alcohol phosphatidyltransferase family protein [Candidatus Hydrogenedentota bacterium]